MNQELKFFLEEQDYLELKVVKLGDKDILCGLRRFMFTTGLVIGLDEEGYFGRYCFKDLSEAKQALQNLVAIPSDYMIGGEWIKFKSELGDISNPALKKDDE